MDNNSEYSKNRSTTRDREGRADDPSAGVSNNNLENIDCQFPRQRDEEKVLQTPRNVSVPCTLLVPPKIQLSTEDDVKHISEEGPASQDNDTGKGKTSDIPQIVNALSQMF